jgi:endoglucanase
MKAVSRRRMNQRLLAGVLTAWATVAFLASCRTARAAPALPLHTSGRFIMDSNGTRVHLNGVNWYGAESTDFVVAGLQAATLANIVQQIQSLGFNVVRLPWSNQLYETNPVVGNYALAANPAMEGENALTILDQVIAALTHAGIMVILDNHNSDAEWCCSTTDGNSLWYNSDYPQANWIADWQGIVTRYKSNPMVIGVDLRNEPRSPATWGGSAADDWHAAAELGGNAVLGVNPNLLVFVEGVNYALDLSGVANLPVQLNAPNQLVYEAHNYSFDDSGLNGYSSYLSQINSAWGYLVTGSNPQPLWIGEFGTCNTANTCVNSGSNGDGGYWFNILTAYIQQNSVDWTYWAVNGTESTGSGRTYGAAETYGVLNAAWNSTANSEQTARLQSIMVNAPASISLVGSGGGLSVSPGGSASESITIVPGNGFSGTVNLACAVSDESGASNVPACSVPATVSVTGNATATATVSLTTTAARDEPPMKRMRTAGGVALAGGFLLIGTFKRHRRVFLALLILIASIGLAGFSGCGGSGATNNGGNGSGGTTSGAYTVTLTATASGVSAASTQIALAVQ